MEDPAQSASSPFVNYCVSIAQTPLLVHSQLLMGGFQHAPVAKWLCASHCLLSPQEMSVHVAMGVSPIGLLKLLYPYGHSCEQHLV